MKKTLINILKSSLFGILLFGVISCDNIFSNKVSDTENTETLLKISVDDTSLARTLYPSSDASLLSDFTLTCTREGFTTKTKTAADLDALKALVINFADGEEGSWQIQLQASYEISSGTNVQAIAFSDTQSVNVQKNKLNEVSFKLTTENLAVGGGLNIKVSFSGSADRVVASFKDETKETSIDEKTFTTSDFTIIEDEKSITFTRSISDTSEALTSGTYYLLFSFYDTTLSSETPLNTLPNYVRIVKGLTTSAELSISLNEVYTITYEDNGGTLASGAIKTGKYSRKSIVNLPQMEKEGYIFAGWYEASDFSGDPVTTIEKGSSGNKTFFARFVSSTLFVSQTGNNENDGMTASTPLSSVNKAVEKIISYGNIAAAYTIKISGTITGGVNIASTLTTEMASSLTLEGVTGKTGDTWVDVLDGGFTAGNTGTTLTLSTKVPVIIKNLKITGGYARDSGGIELYAKSFLTMDSGEISGNTGLDHAGGVYLHHGNGTWNGSSYTNVIPGAVFTMNGGTICNNTGEGITLYDGVAPGEFNMNGGTITGNSGYGVNIVYSTGPFGKFTMKGDAVVASNNKVFIGFPNGTKIYIAGELTGSTPVATVSLNGYNENTEIVALAEGVTDTSLLSAACAKIEVAPNNSTPWYLTSDGKLTATDPNGGSGHTPNLDDFSLVSGAIISTNLANSGFSSCSTEPITIRDLYVCTHEVTQAEYTEYCIYGGTAPEEGGSYPVYNVSWYDAIVYCNLRSLDENLMPVYSINNKTNPAQWPGKGDSDGKYCGPDDTNSDWEWNSGYPGYDSIVVNNDANGYRLPTAIEWEYFARGGNGLATEVASLPNSGCSDEDLRNYAHVDSYNEIESSVYPVKDKDSNTLGLYDLCGNVKELCFDVQADGDYRTTFDGYYIQNGQGSIESYTRDSSTGFRVVRNVHNSVDFGTGVKWATTNVGAETIADYGAYYAWGETDTRYNEVYRSNKVISWKSGYTNGYSWTGYEDGTDGENFTKYTNVLGNNVLSNSDDVATQKRGAKWRMPTPEECQALLDVCYMEFTDNYNGSKIPGVILYKAKAPDDAGHNKIKESTFVPSTEYSCSDTHIFFPAAGYFTSATDSDCGLNSFKSDVLIWTNTIWENYTTGDTARMVPLKSNAGYTDSIDDAPRYYGFSVRPVYIGD